MIFLIADSFVLESCTLFTVVPLKFYSLEHRYVSNFTEGAYLSWEVQLPSRLRLMEVPGPLPNNNALLLWSGLLFGGGNE